MWDGASLVLSSRYYFVLISFVIGSDRGRLNNRETENAVTFYTAQNFVFLVCSLKSFIDHRRNNNTWYQSHVQESVGEAEGHG
jgi:hypothetical protein